MAEDAVQGTASGRPLERLTWARVQTYLRWVNHFLVNKDLPEITFLEEAVEDGIILMRILEHYSGKVRAASAANRERGSFFAQSVAGLQSPQRKSQMSTIRKIDNLTRCFTFMKAERVPIPQFEPAVRSPCAPRDARPPRCSAGARASLHRDTCESEG